MFVSQHLLLRFETWSIVLASVLSWAAAEAGNPTLSCQRSCGDIRIDYPFGIGEGCFKQGFEITCNNSYGPPKPFLQIGDDRHEVVDISVAHNQVRVRITVVSTKGFYQNGTAVTSDATIDLTDTPFVFNSTANKFTLTGCNSFGSIALGGNIQTGCLSLCDDNLTGVADGSCSGRGCCQISIYGVKIIVIAIQSLYNHSMTMYVFNESHVSNSHDCGYGFVADQESYTFEVSDLDRCSSSKMENASVVLDWVIGNETCEVAGKSRDSYACKGLNNDCVGYGSGSIGPSYRCSCKQGYEGNPYLSSGCRDINECMAPHNPCQGKTTCVNLPGSYHCKASKFPTWQLGLAIGGPLFLLLLAPSLYICMKRRKLMNLKQKFFQQNGGLLLQQQIAFHKGSGQPTKIFTTQELAKATDNYAESRVIGQGGNGTVYRGNLCDGRVIATQITTLVKGTLGYLDPEYFQTSQLTEKSDVYSFGVVLAELLTGQLSVSFARPEDQRNLSAYFILAMQRDCLFEILVPGLANDGNKEQLKAVADLAMRCLRLKGERRPTMKEVVFELAGSRGIHKHPWDHVNHDEAQCLLDEQSELHGAESSSTVSLYSDMSTRPLSIHNSETFSIEFP
ncbi:hypothetical protein V6N13_008862 [Hibiscus sabdariffa]